MGLLSKSFSTHAITNTSTHTYFEHPFLFRIILCKFLVVNWGLGFGGISKYTETMSSSDDDDDGQNYGNSDGDGNPIPQGQNSGNQSSRIESLSSSWLDKILNGEGFQDILAGEGTSNYVQQQQQPQPDGDGNPIPQGQNSGNQSSPIESLSSSWLDEILNREGFQDILAGEGTSNYVQQQPPQPGNQSSPIESLSSSWLDEILNGEGFQDTLAEEGTSNYVQQQHQPQPGQSQAPHFSTYQIESTYGPPQYGDGNPIPQGQNSGNRSSYQDILAGEGTSNYVQQPQPAQSQAANFSTYQIGSTYGPPQYRDGNPIPQGRNSGQYNETPFSNLFYEDPHGPHLGYQNVDNSTYQIENGPNQWNQNAQNLGQAPLQVLNYNMDFMQPQPEEPQIAFPNYQLQNVGPNLYGQNPGI